MAVRASWSSGQCLGNLSLWVFRVTCSQNKAFDFDLCPEKACHWCGGLAKAEEADAGDRRHGFLAWKLPQTNTQSDALLFVQCSWHKHGILGMLLLSWIQLVGALQVGQFQ